MDLTERGVADSQNERVCVGNPGLPGTVITTQVARHRQDGSVLVNSA